MAIKPLHYYLADVLVLYKIGDEPRQRRLNTVFARPDGKIPLRALHKCRVSVTTTLMQQIDLEEDGLIDIVFGAITYLGHMTETEFSSQDGPEMEEDTPLDIPGYTDPNPRLS